MKGTEIDPEECSVWCFDIMKNNDSCEDECNSEAWNYGNYYRWFPDNQDNFTDWIKLKTQNLFKIGDNAHIEPSDEYEKSGM